MQYKSFQVRSDFMHLFESQLTVDGYTALIWAWWSDAVELRWPPMLLAGVRNFALFVKVISRCSQA